MDITRVILEMIANRVDKKFEEADKIISTYNEKIESNRKSDKKWINSLGEKIAKEAEEKFEKAVKARFPKAEFENSYSYRSTACFDFTDHFYMNADYLEEKSSEKFKDEVMEKCKQIAVENGPKTAFGEIDKYLETVDPVKTLKLK